MVQMFLANCAAFLEGSVKLEDKMCALAIEEDAPRTIDGTKPDKEVLADYWGQNNKARSQIVKYLGPYALNI